ncbi:flavin reductase (DIM6/NTAB) family NADH-FMN oxidoreductase RutF [Actinocorallia herbida]|uniref:Flavin reductase (DIM6/NTAB) family NADH-FMN oxidoreductase RutF n=1 Tax=Actinocorallia herbida TaxID=58109 RepID=A0A3N1D890_9ACTN|nr:flavin reductase family protein [Actinocorallia herbida]ROO89706.1 flavin reductase (DIM6/NTAB) family NADH-FMN oxidoreductase RutF [Actinocorallia herbida]
MSASLTRRPKADPGTPSAVTEPNARRGIGADLYREALGAHAAGVVVITGHPESGPIGLAATSFAAVSQAPPLVSYYAAHSSGTFPALSRLPYFGVNVLAEGQRDIAARFAAPGVDRFAGTAWRAGPHGVPLLDGAAVHLVCRTYDRLDLGDHTLEVGYVLSADVTGSTPLLYVRGSFGGFVPDYR